MLKKLLFVALASSSFAFAGAISQSMVPLNGTVVAIADGDTLTLLDSNFVQHKIRLAYIDAPEKSQAFGEASKKSLSNLAYSKQAQAYCPSIDRYQRRVCEVVVEGLNVNRAQVFHGMAWVYAAYAPKNSPLLELQAQAREQQLGLWRDDEPVAPWEFRRKK